MPFRVFLPFLFHISTFLSMFLAWRTSDVDFSWVFSSFTRFVRCFAFISNSFPQNRSSIQNRNFHIRFIITRYEINIYSTRKLSSCHFHMFSSSAIYKLTSNESESEKISLSTVDLCGLLLLPFCQLCYTILWFSNKNLCFCNAFICFESFFLARWRHQSSYIEMKIFIMEQRYGIHIFLHFPHITWHSTMLRFPVDSLSANRFYQFQSFFSFLLCHNSNIQPFTTLEHIFCLISDISCARFVFRMLNFIYEHVVVHFLCQYFLCTTRDMFFNRRGTSEKKNSRISYFVENNVFMWMDGRIGNFFFRYFLVAFALSASIEAPNWTLGSLSYCFKIYVYTFLIPLFFYDSRGVKKVFWPYFLYLRSWIWGFFSANFFASHSADDTSFMFYACKKKLGTETRRKSKQ